MKEVQLFGILGTYENNPDLTPKSKVEYHGSFKWDSESQKLAGFVDDPFGKKLIIGTLKPEQSIEFTGSYLPEGRISLGRSIDYKMVNSNGLWKGMYKFKESSTSGITQSQIILIEDQAEEVQLVPIWHSSLHPRFNIAKYLREAKIPFDL